MRARAPEYRRFDRIAGATSVFVIALLNTGLAAGDSNTQVWGEMKLTWIKSHHLTLGVDIEPKVLVSKPSGDPGWATLDVTPSAEYMHGSWLDVVGELLMGRTHQTDDLDSTEITPRLGVRFHILSNLKNELLKERTPRHRFVLRNLARIEWRHLYYSTDKPDSSTVRLRDRVETSYPLNKARVTNDGAIYLLGDAEWFWTQDDLDERFASKQRFRAGVGHRQSVRWRFESLFVWERSRKTATDGFTTADYAIDVRARRVW
jgi:hypothetical protein